MSISIETANHKSSELELGAVDALRGADNVKQRLLLEMSTGTPSISDLAYAIKIRAKEDYKIVEKVLKKRKIKKYGVGDLTDTVGLRIVTLYRLDTLEIFPILLEKIESNSVGPDRLVGPRGIKEIIIYSTNPKGDAQDLPGRVAALCQAFGLSDKTKIEQTPQNYSSIHVVVWCRGKYRGGYRDIPVEIQIRTAFEDVWGEIDHSLKYKRELESENLEREEIARLELNEAHLNVMKTLIDGLAQYGDQIKLQMEGDRRIRAKKSRRSSQAVDRLKQVPGLDENARRIVESAVAVAQEALEQSDIGRLRRRRRAAGDIIRATEKLNILKLGDEHMAELGYVLEMERALLLFEIGNEVGGAGGNAALVDASRIYSEMEKAYPERIVPIYRLARTLDELGDVRSARSKYQQAVDALVDCDLPEDHWLRSAAPTLLAFAYWEDAVKWLEAALGADEHDKAVKDLETAIILSQSALKAAPADDEEGVKAANNLLYYILDYMVHVKDQRFLEERELGMENVSKMTARLSANAIGDAARWDTVRRAYDQLEDCNGAIGASNEVIKLLSDPSRRERWSVSESGMLRDARVTLARWAGDESDDTERNP